MPNDDAAEASTVSLVTKCFACHGPCLVLLDPSCPGILTIYKWFSKYMNKKPTLHRQKSYQQLEIQAETTGEGEVSVLPAWQFFTEWKNLAENQFYHYHQPSKAGWNSYCLPPATCNTFTCINAQPGMCLLSYKLIQVMYSAPRLAPALQNKTARKRTHLRSSLRDCIICLILGYSTRSCLIKLASGTITRVSAPGHEASENTFLPSQE